MLLRVFSAATDAVFSHSEDLINMQGHSQGTVSITHIITTNISRGVQGLFSIFLNVSAKLDACHVFVGGLHSEY